jgi:hypothetical protein
MPERTRVDRDRRKRAPEEAVIESWVENPGIYLTLPSDDPLRDNTGIGPTASTPAARGK